MICICVPLDTRPQAGVECHYDLSSGSLLAASPIDSLLFRITAETPRRRKRAQTPPHHAMGFLFFHGVFDRPWLAFKIDQLTSQRSSIVAQVKSPGCACA